MGVGVVAPTDAIDVLGYVKATGGFIAPAAIITTAGITNLYGMGSNITVCGSVTLSLDTLLTFPVGSSIAGNLAPNTTGTQNIGLPSAGNKWNAVYANNFNGTNVDVSKVTTAGLIVEGVQTFTAPDTNPPDGNLATLTFTPDTYQKRFVFTVPSTSVNKSLINVTSGVQGQKALLCVISAPTSTCTLIVKHGTGNIRCSTGTDLTISDNGLVSMFYDAVGGYWRAASI
jgi:hypothetical protein